jgi:hypothetical protein
MKFLYFKLYFCSLLTVYQGVNHFQTHDFLDIVMRKNDVGYDKILKYEFVFIDFLLSLIRSKGQLLIGGEGATHGDSFSTTSS